MQYSFILVLECVYYVKDNLIHFRLLYPTHQWKQITAPCDTDHETLPFRDYFGRLLITFANHLNSDQAQQNGGTDHDS